MFKQGGTAEDYYQQMDELIGKLGPKCAAVGECGLDYDRLDYSDKQTQLKVFPMHFELAAKHRLPMYLHSRNCAEDFVRIVKENRKKFSTACVHSFTGGAAELKELLALDLYIGINGCSLKTEQNVEVMKLVPLDKLMIESRPAAHAADSPYCEINKTHFGYDKIKTHFDSRDKKKWTDAALVKSRNEPCKIVYSLFTQASRRSRRALQRPVGRRRRRCSLQEQR